MPIAQTTSYKVVLPFYFYAAISFVVAALLLVFHTDVFSLHHFQPATLAITHVMALGWGTMMILGASHQLLPVLSSGKLYSVNLAYLSFIAAGVGIPCLIFGFYYFSMGFPSLAGAILINVAVLSYFINVLKTVENSKGINVQSLFMYTATLWLLVTTMMGLLLVWNFTADILPRDSLSYLSLHAHLGIIGWFLLFIMGVGSRLIPMFLISKYSNPQLLYIIFGLVNAGLLIVVYASLNDRIPWLIYVALMLILSALICFVFYIRKSFITRLRRQVDDPLKLSMISVFMMMLPLVTMIILLFVSAINGNSKIILAYGFSVFFGWITAIIFGMTFKTLPFIVWNKVYHTLAGKVKVPAPKDLYNDKLVKIMNVIYLASFVGFITGIILQLQLLLQIASVAIALAGILYLINVVSVIFHKSVVS